MLDPIVEEGREAQERLMAEFNNGFQRYGRALRKQQEKQKRQGVKYISFKPRCFSKNGHFND